MMNYYERYQPDVVLAYNDLAKEAEAFGCGVKYSGLRRALDRGATCWRTRPSLRQARDARSLRDGAAARLPRAVRGAREGSAARGHRRRRGGPWTIAMLLRNPEMMLLDTFEDPQFIHDLMRLTTDFCKRWGDAIAKTKIGLSLLRAHGLHQPDLAGQLPRVHRALPQGAGGLLQGQEGRASRRHICGDDLSDLRGPHRLRLHHRLLRPRPAGRPDAPRGPARAVHGGGQGPRGGHRQRGRDQVREDHAGRRSRPRCGAASTRAARHSGFILSTSCEIPPRSNPEIVKWFMDAAHDYGRYERSARLSVGGTRARGAESTARAPSSSERRCLRRSERSGATSGRASSRAARRRRRDRRPTEPAASAAAAGRPPPRPARRARGRRPGARRLRVRDVHGQLAAVEILAVELRDGALGLLGAWPSRRSRSRATGRRTCR